MKSTLFLLVVALFLAGCSRSNQVKSAPAAQTPNGWTAIDGEGFSLSVPAGWEQVDIDPDKLADSMSAMSKDVPQLRAMADIIKNLPPTVKYRLFVLDKSMVGQPFVNNINVVEETLPVAASLKEVADASARSMEPMVGKLERKMVQLPIGEVEERRFSMALGNGVKSDSVAYLIVNGKTSYNVTFTLVGGTTAPVDEIMKTFRVD